MAPETRAKAKALVTPAVTWGDESDLTEPETSDEEEDELEQEQPAPKSAAPPSTRHALPKPPPVVAKATAKAGPSTGTGKTRPSTQRSTAQSRKLKEAQQHSYLSQPSSNAHGLPVIYELVEAGMIDLNPDYQRDVVWPESKQIMLIDSIRHNYPIPPVICSLRHDECGNLVRTCIDGKQRLTSIWRFMNGEIPYKDSITGKKWWWAPPKDPKAKGKVMSDQWKRDFKMKTLLVSDFQNLTPEQEREIFHRVQLGVSLTQPERLQAVNGVYAEVIRQFRKELGVTTVFRNFSEWGGNRGKDFLALAQIAFLTKNLGNKTPFEPTPQRLDTWLHKEYSQPDQLRDALKHAFDIFCRIVHHELYGKAITDIPLAPLEFVLSVYLIHIYKKRMTDCQTSDAIDQLRGALKTANKDCKWTAKSFKAGIAFVEKIAKLPVKTDDVKIFSADMPPLDPAVLMADASESSPESPSKGKKRARAQTNPPSADEMEVDEMVEEEAPAKAVKKRKVTPTTKGVAPASQKPADEDSDSDPDVPLVKSEPKPRLSGVKSITKQPKSSTSAAATKVRKTSAKAKTAATAISKPTPSVFSPTEPLVPSISLQTARSFSHPSRTQSTTNVQTQATSAAPTPQVPAAHAPHEGQGATMSGQGAVQAVPQAQSQASFSRTSEIITKAEQLSSLGVLGSGSSLRNPGGSIRAPSEDRLAALRMMRRPPLSVATSQEMQHSELSAAVHKLPTPPVQDDFVRAQNQRSTPLPSRSASIQRETVASPPTPISAPPMLNVASAAPAGPSAPSSSSAATSAGIPSFSSAGDTKKLFKGMKFAKIQSSPNISSTPPQSVQQSCFPGPSGGGRLVPATFPSSMPSLPTKPSAAIPTFANREPSPQQLGHLPVLMRRPVLPQPPPTRDPRRPPQVGPPPGTGRQQ